MATTKTLNSTRVHGDRVVRRGETVDLVPVAQMPKDPEAGDYFNDKHFAFLRRWLGNGPFTIINIYSWPCGMVMLSLKTNDGDNSGNPAAYASDFM